MSKDVVSLKHVETVLLLSRRVSKHNNKKPPKNKQNRMLNDIIQLLVFVCCILIYIEVFHDLYSANLQATLSVEHVGGLVLFTSRT
jgi:hypothetical protein